MMARTILSIGDPALRRVAQPVSSEQLESVELQQLVDDLIATMRAALGAGIAATQVGELLRVFIVEVNDNPRYPFKPNIPLTVLINPEIDILSDETFENFEGCLSVPGLRGRVCRNAEVRVRGLDRKGELVDFEVRGLSAGTFQHELDHLDGMLFTDRLIDPTSLTTCQNYDRYYNDTFAAEARAIVARWGH